MVEAGALGWCLGSAGEGEISGVLVDGPIIKLAQDTLKGEKQFNSCAWRSY